MSGANDGWSRLARNLKTEIDEDLIEAYRGARLAALRGGGAPAGGDQDSG